MRTLRPFLPKLRSVLLSKISEADPVAIERALGAAATAFESILFYAPGDPLPRAVLVFVDGRLELVDAEGADGSPD